MEPVLFVWSSASTNGRRNLLFGLDTQTWGFKQHELDYAEPASWVIFGHNHSSGSPRMGLDEWRAGTVGLMLCQLTAPMYVGRAPHWPDEVDTGQIIYPHRFGLTPVASLSHAAASSSGPLGAVGSDALRNAGIRNRGVRAFIDINPLLDAMGVPLVTMPAGPDLSRTPGHPDPAIPAVRDYRGAGRSQDPEFRAAVERHAAQLATRHMLARGWDKVEELGKPFDLVCTKPGEERHVEVKGSSGAGAEVAYTPNEVRHFRDCPYGADLIVIRDIAVDFSARPYTATGGLLLHVENYRAPTEDLQATGWLGRVPGWEQFGNSGAVR